MSQSHGIKGGTTDEVFQEQCFLQERGAFVGADFAFFNFEDLLHAQDLKETLKESKTKA